MKRDYGTITTNVAKTLAPGAARECRMRTVVVSLWEQLGDAGVSWIGFYLYVPEREELVLGPRRDKPACSPIGVFDLDSFDVGSFDEADATGLKRVLAAAGHTCE